MSKATMWLSWPVIPLVKQAEIRAALKRKDWEYRFDLGEKHFVLRGRERSGKGILVEPVEAA